MPLFLGIDFDEHEKRHVRFDFDDGRLERIESFAYRRDAEKR